MGFSDVFSVVKELFLDWRLIAAFVVVFLYLNFVFYVSRYKKKATPKPKRIVKQQEAPAAATDGGDSGQSSEGQDGGASGDDDFV